MSFDDGSGYDLDDPKHPTWADRMADRADDERKRAKEEGRRPDDVAPHHPYGIGAHRQALERIRATEHQPSTRDFFCECDDYDCTGRLPLTLGELLDVRAAYPTPNGFYVVLKGHEHGEPVVLQGVSMSGGAYAVVSPPRRPRPPLPPQDEVHEIGGL